jgi:hypothetical protein
MWKASGPSLLNHLGGQIENSEVCCNLLNTEEQVCHGFSDTIQRINKFVQLS